MEIIAIIIAVIIGGIYITNKVLNLGVKSVKRIIGSVFDNNYDVADFELDPVRFFTKQQRDEGMRDCHNRCEGYSMDDRRCTYIGDDLQGDHWFPYSKGGRTSKKNMVMLCPACNRVKHARVPNEKQTKALMWRRANGIGGYSRRINQDVGEWLPWAAAQRESQQAGTYTARKR